MIATMKAENLTRRKIIESSLGVGLLIIARSAESALMMTPLQSEGPFYPTSADRLSDIDNDLVLVEGATREAGGKILHLEGRILFPDGQPLAEALVEIWQCDVNGRYIHHLDRLDSIPRDPYFQGYGKTITNETGYYSFRTIQPVKYPGRTPHIHVRLTSKTLPYPLTTQIYIAGDPLNNSDILFRRLNAAQRRSVSLELETDSGNDLRGVFDIVVG